MLAGRIEIEENEGVFINLKLEKLVFFVLELQKFQTESPWSLQNVIRGWGKYLAALVFNVFVKFQLLDLV